MANAQASKCRHAGSWWSGTHHRFTGEAMKFLMLADWTAMVETELFAATYRSYGLATVRCPVLEITAASNRLITGAAFRCVSFGRANRVVPLTEESWVAANNRR